MAESDKNLIAAIEKVVKNFESHLTNIAGKLDILIGHHQAPLLGFPASAVTGNAVPVPELTKVPEPVAVKSSAELLIKPTQAPARAPSTTPVPAPTAPAAPAPSPATIASTVSNASATPTTGTGSRTRTGASEDEA
jgi:hypothetical protein